MVDSLIQESHFIRASGSPPRDISIQLSRVVDFSRGDPLERLQRLLASQFSLFISWFAFLRTFATFRSHVRLSYSNAYRAYDNAAVARSEIVVD